MRILFHTLISIIVIALLHLTKIFLSKSAASYFFLFNLLSCAQFFALFVCIVTILIYLFVGNQKKGIAVLGLLTTLGALIVLELTCTQLLNHPDRISKNLRKYFQAYYLQYDMGIFQFEPQCADYDPALFYSMKKNSRFVFSNREYGDSFYTNRQGFRDRRDDVRADVVCIGDSFTMGYGVDQDSTFSAQLERLSTLRVLNAGMSSYGTARESLTFSKIDLSEAKLVIWQYCDNDAPENKAFLENNFKYSPSSETTFSYYRRQNYWQKKYFPFKHFLTIIKMAASTVLKRATPDFANNTADVEKDARNFLRIVKAATADRPGIKIIVTELGFYRPKSQFLASINDCLKTAEFAALAHQVNVVDVFPCLEAANFYELDMHIKPAGQKAIATCLAKVVERLINHQ